MSLIAILKIKPHRRISLGQKGVKKDWNLFFNTLFWNLNFWDNVSTLAGEVDKPQKNFPIGLMAVVIFTCLAYLIPLLAVTGAISVDQNLWETGFHADAADIIAGKWLKVWLEIGAVLSATGLLEAQLSSRAYQVLGKADIGILPKFCSIRSKKFKTPFVGILVSTIIALAISYMNFSHNFISKLLVQFGNVLGVRILCLAEKKNAVLEEAIQGSNGVTGFDNHVLDSISISDICDGNCHKDCVLGEWHYDGGWDWLVLFQEILKVKEITQIQ